MSNHDYVIDNAVGATVRADINSALVAIATTNSSATEPATMYAYQLWFDTSVGYMKQRNSTNTAWVALSIATATAAAHAVRLDQFNAATWTPTDTSGAGLSLTLLNCLYLKIGAIVIVSGRITYPATADASNASFSIPVAAVAMAGGHLGSNVTGGVDYYLGASLAYVQITTPAGANLTNAQMSGKELDLTITYLAANT